jgi:hypothetical protein
MDDLALGHHDLLLGFVWFGSGSLDELDKYGCWCVLASILAIPWSSSLSPITVLLIVLGDALLGRQHHYACVLWCLALVSPWLLIGKRSWDSFGFGWDLIPPSQCLSCHFLLFLLSKCH